MSRQAKIPNLQNTEQTGWRYTESIVAIVKLLAAETKLSQSDVVSILLASTLRRFEGKKSTSGKTSFSMPTLFEVDAEFGFAEVDKWIEVFEGVVGPWDVAQTKR